MLCRQPTPSPVQNRRRATSAPRDAAPNIVMQVQLSFYEKRARQQWGLGFGKQEERLFWEQWCAAVVAPVVLLPVIPSDVLHVSQKPGPSMSSCTRRRVIDLQVVESGLASEEQNSPALNSCALPHVPLHMLVDTRLPGLSDKVPCSDRQSEARSRAAPRMVGKSRQLHGKGKTSG